jgi:hypothetical protein
MVDLDDPVEQFLCRTGALLDPGLLRAWMEELGRLYDGDSRVVIHVWQHFVQEFSTGAEICVEDGEEIALSPSKGPSQIAGFLKVRFVVAAETGESVSFGECLDRVETSIVVGVDLEVQVF